IRSASTLSRNDPAAEGGTSGALLEPQLRMVYNSAIPFSLNEGALWAGRGLNMELATGGIARVGPVTVIFMPSISSQRNEDFQTLPCPSCPLPARSVPASPWSVPPESLDRPSRFGRASTYSASLGQSSVTVRGGGVAGGFATENLWWGPGIRNALLMSN